MLQLWNGTDDAIVEWLGLFGSGILTTFAFRLIFDQKLCKRKEPMKIRVDKNDVFVEIRLEEERLDSSVSPRLKSDLVMLHSEGCVNMLLDLSAVSYIDSSGLSALLVGNRLCTSSGGKVVLTGLSPFVTGLLQISRLDTLLQVAPDMQAARLEFSAQ